MSSSTGAMFILSIIILAFSICCTFATLEDLVKYKRMREEIMPTFVLTMFSWIGFYFIVIYILIH